ncbi:small integral membrane protein 29 [Hoplias malabaricus]|uniref:small integral membrane protein 29 n=1 Tax=Hoplias malabaricus TaxID=27720 RepID=UPI0034628A82
MNTTTQTPPIDSGDTGLGYILLPFFSITFIGIIVAVVLYLRRKQRIDRLRHQLLPVYAYDPSEELSEEQDVLWREEDTKVVRGWMRNYHQHSVTVPLTKNPSA